MSRRDAESCARRWLEEALLTPAQICEWFDAGAKEEDYRAVGMLVRAGISPKDAQIVTTAGPRPALRRTDTIFQLVRQNRMTPEEAREFVDRRDA